MNRPLDALGLESGPVVGRGATTLVVATRADAGVGGPDPHAVKVASDPHDAVTNDRLRHEARVLERLRHPHVVPGLGLHQTDRAGGTVGLALALARGGSLRSLLRTCGPPPRPTELAIQLAGALAQVHRCGVVHGDITTANVLLQGRRHLWLADFDRARILIGDHAEDGDDDARRADVRATAGVILELATGTRVGSVVEARRLLDDHAIDFAPNRVDALLAALDPACTSAPADGAELEDALLAPPPTVPAGRAGSPDRAPVAGTRGSQRTRVLAGAGIGILGLTGLVGIIAGVAEWRVPTTPVPPDAPPRLEPMAVAGEPTCPGDRLPRLDPGAVATTLRRGDTCRRLVVWRPADATIDVGTDRFRVGAPGDHAVFGDWDGDGTDEPAIYRPASGVVARFDRWARPSEPQPAATIEATGVVNGAVTVARRAGALDRIDVRRVPPD